MLIITILIIEGSTALHPQQLRIEVTYLDKLLSQCLQWLPNKTFDIIRPAILELFGINYWAYPDEQRAVKLADEKIRKNREAYPAILKKIERPEFQDIMSEVDPDAGSEFYFVHYMGLNKSQAVTIDQEYSMEGDLNKKPIGDAVDEWMSDALAIPATAEEKQAADEKKLIEAGIAKVDGAFKELSKTYFVQTRCLIE